MAKNDMKMKIQIDGDNKGFKKSLNESTLDMKNFVQTAQGMAGGRGIGPALAAGGSAIAAYAASNKFSHLKNKNFTRDATSALTLDNILAGHKKGKNGPAERAANALHAQNRSMAKGHPGRPDLQVSKKHIAYQATVAEHRAFLKSERANRRKGNRIELKNKAIQALPAILKAASVVGAVASVAALVIGPQMTKWQKRVNEASAQYSGAAMGNRARLEAENTRRDIRLARTYGSSTVMRDNAANFRRNSGTEVGGGIANMAGAAFDVGVGAFNNVIGFNMTGGPLGWVYRQMTSEGGPK